MRARAIITDLRFTGMHREHPLSPGGEEGEGRLHRGDRAGRARIKSRTSCVARLRSERDAKETCVRGGTRGKMGSGGKRRRVGESDKDRMKEFPRIRGEMLLDATQVSRFERFFRQRADRSVRRRETKHFMEITK